MSLPAREPGSRLGWLLTFLSVAALYGATFSFRPTTDAYLNVVQTRSLVLHGDVDIARYEPNAGFYIPRGDRVYSLYGVGVSVMAAPLIAPLAHADASVIAHHAIPAIVYAAAAVTAMFTLLLRIFPRSIAIGGTALFAFGTTLWPVATTAFWAHAPVAFLLALGMIAFFDERSRAPGWAGLALGAAAFVRPITTPVAIAVGAWYLTRGARPSLRFAAGASVPIAATLVQNAILWGSPFRTGYAFFDVGFGGDVLAGVEGVLFSWWRGAFVYTPALILGVIGTALALRRWRDPAERRFAALGLGAIAVVLAYTRFTVWWGGSEQFGYRYLLDAVPMLVVTGAYLVARAPALRAPAAVLTAASIAVMILGSQPHSRGWDDRDFPSGLADAPLGLAWSAFVDSPWAALARLAGGALVVAVLWYVSRPREARG